MSVSHEAMVESPTVHRLLRQPRGTIEQQDRHRARLARLEILLGLITPALLIAAWEVAARLGWISAVIFPAPSELFPAAVKLVADGKLLTETAVTLRVILLGFAIGAITGVVLGIACGTVRMIRAALEPMLNALYVIPKLALLPIFLLIFGFGGGPKLALVGITVFFYVWIQTMEAVTSIPKGYLETAKTFELNRRQMLTEIYMPATLPQVFVGLRIAMSVSVLVTIAAEFVIGGEGLGFLIFNARTLMQITTMYVGIIWVSLLGVTLTYAITILGHSLTPWSDSKSERYSPT